MRVLIVEDDPFIALDLVEQLTQASYQTIGPASTVADALRLVASEIIQGAVLDVNLGRETAEPIAIELSRQDVPFICVSGYDTDQLPEEFRDAPCLVKPFQIDRLLDMLRRLGEKPS